jgi:aerobic carbon-monoxide dehydrogenase medium subunit
MIPTSFDYVRASSLREALNALAAADGTKVIAGGHSLLPVMKFRMAQPSRLIDIAHLPELRGVSEYRRGARIGATTTYRELQESPILRERFPLIAEACHTIGDLQVRNRGTIGGSVAHADPASDMPAVLLVLDATLNLRSKRGKRSVGVREFFQGAFTTALAEDELLTDITLPALPRGAGAAYVSFDQAASGYAIAGAAAVVGRTRSTISHVAVALTGLGEVAMLLPSAAQLIGTRGDAGTLATVAAEGARGLEVGGDIHAPAEFRRHLASVVIRRALERALERAR